MKKYFEKIRNNTQGVSLLELVVSIGIFIIVSSLVGGIYLNVINVQKKSIGLQTTQESLRFIIEMISKELRMAQGSLGGSDCGPNGSVGHYKIFNGSDNGGATITSDLYFKNKKGDCVIYKKITDGTVNRLHISRGSMSGYATPNELDIEDLKFFINDVRANEVGQFQPSITIMIKAKAPGMSDGIVAQTTVSSREYTY